MNFLTGLFTVGIGVFFVLLGAGFLQIQNEQYASWRKRRGKLVVALGIFIALAGIATAAGLIPD